MLDSELKFRSGNTSNELSQLSSTNYANSDKNEKIIIHKQQQTRGHQQSALSLENLCWLIASGACLYYSDIVKVIFWEEKINKKLLYFAFSLISVNILIGIYLIIYLTNYKKIPSSKWNDYNPFLIPIATGAFILGSILLTVCLWPVFSWLTAPILFTIFMGFIVIIINIPI